MLLSVLGYLFGALFFLFVLGSTYLTFSLSHRWKKMKQLRDQFLSTPPVPVSSSSQKGSLVLINPYGGRKQGQKIFKDFVKPMTKHRNWDISRVIETKTGADIQKMFDPSSSVEPSLASSIFENYSSLIIVGGDGFLHHIMNGLIRLYRHQHPSSSSLPSPSSAEERKVDHQTSTCLWGNFPIAIVPAGSSNGTSFSFGHSSPAQAVQQLLTSAQVRDMDLMEVTLQYDGQSQRKEEKEEKQIYYAGLIVSWALISDHDYFQEHMFRSLDPMYKNILAPLCVILSKRVYRGKILIQPVQEPPIATLLSQGYTDYRTPDVVTGVQTGHKVARWSPVESKEGWYETEDKFLLVTACNLPYAGIDQLLAPQAKISEGALDLIVIRANVSMFQMLSIFAIIDSGKQIFHPLVEYYKVRAFILEPVRLGSKSLKSGQGVTRGMVSVDGELHPAPIKMTIQSIKGGASFLY